METVDYSDLLGKYRELWYNRKLESGNRPQQVLEEAITRDLKDENTHPRARKSLLEKYLLSTKRIAESNLNSEDKIQLIQMHIILAEKIKGGEL